MAEVIYSAPAPGRPNPFYNLGQGWSQGMMLKMEKDAAREARAEEERRKREAEAEQAKRSLSAFKAVMNPATTGMEPGGEGAFASILTTTPEQRAAETPQQRLYALPAEEFAALSKNQPLYENALRAAGLGPEENKTELERLLAGMPEEEREAAIRGRVGKLTGGNEYVTLLAPDGQRRTFSKTDPEVGHRYQEGWLPVGDEAQPRSSVGDLQDDLRQGFISQGQFNARMRKLNESGRQPLRSSAVNLLLPGGSTATGRERPDGSLEMWTESGFARVPPGTQKISTTATGTPAQLGVDRNSLVSVRDTRIAARQAIESANDIQRLVAGRPDLLGVAGRIARLTDDVAAQAVGLANLTGLNVTASRDPSAYAEAFREMGGTAAESAQVQSAIVNMAFAAAAASGQSGRSVSDKDVERFVKEIGASTSSPNTFISVLESFKERVDRNYQIAAEETLGERQESLLGRSPMAAQPPLGPPPDNISPEVWAEMSPEERAEWQ